MATKPLTISLPDTEATHSLGMTLGRSLLAGSVVLLQGDLGSGKTTLAQGIGQGLEIIEPIVSPTFTIINEYLEGRLPLYHLDLYRLNSAEVEALHLEIYWEGVEVPLGIVVIEWAERLHHKLRDYLEIYLTYEAYTRKADLFGMGKFQLNYDELLKR